MAITAGTECIICAMKPVIGVRLTGLLFVVGTATACGPPCKQIAARKTVLQQVAPDQSRPHVQLIIPMDRLNRLLAQNLSPVPPPVELQPALTALAMTTGITVEARRVRVVPARAGYVGFQIELGLTGSPVTSMTVDAEVKPAIVHGKYGPQLTIGFGADTVRQVRPQLAPRIIDELTDVLARRLPKAVTSRVPRLVLREAARRLVPYLSEQGFALLRSQLFDRLGQLTRIHIDLPDAPFARVQSATINHPERALRIDLFTSLPVEQGLAPERAPGKVRGTARLRVANATITAAANWAIATGRLPQRYGSDLKPSPTGEYVPVLQWRTGARPLAVHVFRTSGSCSYVRAAVKPTLRLEGERVVAGYDDREYEQVEGPALLKLGVWLKKWLEWFGYKSRKVAASASLEIGGRRIDGRVVRLKLGPRELGIDVELGVRAQPTKP